MKLVRKLENLLHPLPKKRKIIPISTTNKNLNLAQNVKNGNVAKVITGIRTTEFNKGIDRAYSNKNGYEISEVGKDKVMFVSGSRNGLDWVANAYDVLTPKFMQPLSNHTTKRLNKIAKLNKVDLVVGHSRAGKLVDEMKGPFQKLAVDGAMVISHGPRTTMNLYGKDPFKFDKILSLGGKNNHGVPITAKNTHYVYRNSRNGGTRRNIKHLSHMVLKNAKTYAVKEGKKYVKKRTRKAVKKYVGAPAKKYAKNTLRKALRAIEREGISIAEHSFFP